MAKCFAVHVIRILGGRHTQAGCILQVISPVNGRMQVAIWQRRRKPTTSLTEVSAYCCCAGKWSTDKVWSVCRRLEMSTGYYRRKQNCLLMGSAFLTDGRTVG